MINETIHFSVGGTDRKVLHLRIENQLARFYGLSPAGVHEKLDVNIHIHEGAHKDDGVVLWSADVTASPIGDLRLRFEL